MSYFRRGFHSEGHIRSFPSPPLFFFFLLFVVRKHIFIFFLVLFSSFNIRYLFAYVGTEKKEQGKKKWSTSNFRFLFSSIDSLPLFPLPRPFYLSPFPFPPPPHFLIIHRYLRGDIKFLTLIKWRPNCINNFVLESRSMNRRSKGWTYESSR